MWIQQVHLESREIWTSPKWASQNRTKSTTTSAGMGGLLNIGRMGLWINIPKEIWKYLYRIKIPPCSYDISIVILHFVISAAFFFPAGTAFGHGIPGRWKLGRRAWHAARPMWVAGANIGENNGKHTCIYIKPWHMWYDLIIVDHMWSILLYGSYMFLSFPSFLFCAL